MTAQGYPVVCGITLGGRDDLPENYFNTCMAVHKSVRIHRVLYNRGVQKDRGVARCALIIASV
jgi:hypothetical protein